MPCWQEQRYILVCWKTSVSNWRVASQGHWSNSPLGPGGLNQLDSGESKRKGERLYTGRQANRTKQMTQASCESEGDRCAEGGYVIDEGDAKVMGADGVTVRLFLGKGLLAM